MSHLKTMLGDLYPFESHYLDLDGHRMHYVDEGSGPAIVFLHGNPTWSFYFRRLIREFSSHHRVIAPDHIGCGLSDKPEKYPYTLSTHIANVAKLLDHLEVTDVTLAVHDWGGAIGFGWAVEHVDRVARLVVFNTAAFLGIKGPLRIRLCGLPYVGEIVIRGLNGFARPALYMATARRDLMTPRVRRGYLAPYRSYADRVAHLRFVRDIPYHEGVPSHPVLERIGRRLSRLADRPMMICWGEKDFCFNRRFLDEWCRRFPRAEVHRFHEAGHYVVEDACDMIIPLMHDFLGRTSAAGDT